MSEDSVSFFLTGVAVIMVNIMAFFFGYSTSQYLEEKKSCELVAVPKESNK